MKASISIITKSFIALVGSVIALIGIVLILLIGQFGLVAWYNNYKVDQFLHSLQNMTLPDDTKIIASNSDFGIIWGASNHCDVIVRILLETTKEYSDFSSYSYQPISLAYPFHSVPSHLDVFELKEGELFLIYKNHKTKLINGEIEDNVRHHFPEFFLETREMNGIKALLAKVKRDESQKNYFLLMAFDQTCSGMSFNDIRCH